MLSSGLLVCAVVPTCKLVPSSPALWDAEDESIETHGVLRFGGKVGLQVRETDGLEILVLGILFLKMHWGSAC